MSNRCETPLALRSPDSSGRVKIKPLRTRDDRKVLNTRHMYIAQDPPSCSIHFTNRHIEYDSLAKVLELDGDQVSSIVLESCTLFVRSDNSVTLFTSSNTAKGSYIRTTCCKFIITAPSVTLYDEVLLSQTEYRSSYDEFVINAKDFAVGDVKDLKMTVPGITGIRNINLNAASLDNTSYCKLKNVTVCTDLSGINRHSDRDVTVNVPSGVHNIGASVTNTNSSIIIKGVEIPSATSKSGLDELQEDGYHVMHSSSYKGPVSVKKSGDTHAVLGYESKDDLYLDEFTICRLSSVLELKNHTVNCKSINLTSIVIDKSDVTFSGCSVIVSDCAVSSSTMKFSRCKVSIRDSHFIKSSCSTERCKKVRVSSSIYEESPLNVTNCKLKISPCKFDHSLLSISMSKGDISGALMMSKGVIVSMCDRLKIDGSVIEDCDGAIVVKDNSLVDVFNTSGLNQTGIVLENSSTVRISNDSTIGGGLFDFIVGGKSFKWNQLTKKATNSNLGCNVVMR